ncbi:putative dna repair protein rad16 protein [Venustampulla echinocandica]|uniref:Putative dna repair protein rad16 protein n=1 Tax=Venustampulla echinocandica TaxID=2656787 RepID=A0A370U0R2_9HELO|nr:putative dna repair protein rad16 protein [Venustampulla echinocandica]RDL41370.1 putative dna repair protein rad16 protein [Venustampulla echinocandica]
MADDSSPSTGAANSAPPDAAAGRRRSTRLSMGALSLSATTSNTSAPSSIIGDDAPPPISTSHFLTPSLVAEYPSTMAAQIAMSRASLSSASTSVDYNESSDHSTPATSNSATPGALSLSASSAPRRGRSRVMATTGSEVNLVARAAALRNSKYSLKSKRKRVPDSDDEDADEDNTPDAQLARALQQQEDAADTSMTGMTGMDSESPSSSSRATRPRISLRVAPRKPLPRKILLRAKLPNNVPSAGLSVDDGEIDDDDDVDMVTVPRRKRPNVELSSNGSNAVKFSPAPESDIVMETDDSDILTEPPDSEDLGFGGSDSSRSRKIVPKATTDSEFDDSDTDSDVGSAAGSDADSDASAAPVGSVGASRASRASVRRAGGHIANDRETARYTKVRTTNHNRLLDNHASIDTMWDTLENLPEIGSLKIKQPTNITRELKPFQLEGVAWMMEMEQTKFRGGLLGDEMGMGKTIQAVALIMSDFPAAEPSLVLVPPVALMQWQQEIAAYTDGTLKTFVYHGTNAKTKGVTAKDLQKYNVILMSYNSLESMYRKQEKGFKRKNGTHKEASIMHQTTFHRVILDEAHCIKQRSSGSAKACFALNAKYRWCLSGTPLQNRIGEFFSLIRFLDIRPFAYYLCKMCSCSCLNWDMDADNRCRGCKHNGMQHISLFNHELLNPIQKFGNAGPGVEAFRKLRLLTNRVMLRRVKVDHSGAMELPSKEIMVDREYFGEVENDFASSVMNSSTRRFETYVAQGVLLNNYANIFGLIMQMRQAADHPDLILKKNSEGGQNVLICCICDDTAEEGIKSSCHHDFCRDCAKNYLRASETPDCPRCHIPLSIDLEQPEIDQDEQQVKKSSIINRIKMEKWTSSSKIEALVQDIWQLRSMNSSHKCIIFSQFTTMLQLVEWRLRRVGITTVMLDGSMTPAQRQASVNHFMTDINVECFLVSLKAGGVALNLTEASRVFIVDPWWNPAAEWQSADRCHRIGQSRPCSITRLCIEDSIESRMVLLQEKKANMINSTINGDESAMESLTVEDMQFLFRGT